MPDRTPDLERIEEALRAAAAAISEFTPGAIEVELKAGGDPVTEADKCANVALEAVLPQDGEGWLSEETRDDAVRLDCRRVWVVDPIDGTREFIQGIPEWCISVGLVEDGQPVAGGIFNPTTDELFLGSLETGATLNGRTARPSDLPQLAGGLVLASRSEIRRGEWDPFFDLGFEILPMGSVAYKLARVSAGLATATWTVVPKHEWDVAAGVALVRAAGGRVHIPSGGELEFNRAKPLLPDLAAYPAQLAEEVVLRVGPPVASVN